MNDETPQSTATPTSAASALRAGLERCGTCKNFTRFADGFDREYHGAHAGKCSSEKFIYSSGKKVPLDGLLYWDYEGYSAGFEVGDQFGCIHWVRSNAK